MTVAALADQRLLSRCLLELQLLPRADAAWDDWGRSPAWVRESVTAAQRLTRDEAALGLVIDGDMGVRRTRPTLEALGPEWARRATWFNCDAWSDAEFRRLNRAIDGHRTEGAMPKPDHVSVVIRIDTEPDYQPRYAAVRPQMVSVSAHAG